MTRKAHPSDWDYFFGARPYRRVGPIGLFITLSVFLVLLLGTMFGGSFGAKAYANYQHSMALTATPLWAQYYATQTATAQGRTADGTSAAPATPATPTPTAAPTAKTIAGGNIRTEPRMATETMLGEVQAGETVAVLEQKNVDGMVWLRVRLQTGAEGWISATLVDNVPAGS